MLLRNEAHRSGYRARQMRFASSAASYGLRFPIICMLLLSLTACTQEIQNKFGRAVQNWTGTDGVLEIYAGDKLVKRFLQIDKLSTAVSTHGDTSRSYRFGYGVLDANLNGIKDDDEKKVYFEVSDFSTYIFYDKPK